ncbi:MAG: hypothetical protein JNM13_10670 [Hyphomicrobiaceae bacterium]|nr:hypothetical protein [Hyphomicrobiaceae bacterium]
MTPTNASPFVASLLADGAISAEDVLTLRREVFRDGVVAPSEAELLFQLDEAAGATSPEWRAFFVEALIDHVVRQVEPEGYVTAEQASWLIARMRADGRIEVATELEVLLKTMETARQVPPGIPAEALECVRRHVVHGDNMDRDGLGGSPGSVDAHDVAMLRRVLFAAAGEAGLAVSRAEAEMLFAIDAAVARGNNDAGWADLFARAIGNYLMSTSLQRTPDRETVLNRQKWLDAPTGGIGGLLSGMLGGFANPRAAFSGVGGLLGNPVEDSYAVNNFEDGLKLEDAAEITGDELGWLTRMLGAEGGGSDARRALKRFIEADQVEVSPQLRAVLERLDA